MDTASTESAKVLDVVSTPALEAMRHRERFDWVVEEYGLNRAPLTQGYELAYEEADEIRERMTPEEVARENERRGQPVEYRRLTAEFNIARFAYRLQNLFAGVRRDIELEVLVPAKIPILRVYAPAVAGSVVRSTRGTAKSGRGGLSVTLFGTGFSADRTLKTELNRTIEAGPGEGKQLSLGVQILVRRIRTSRPGGEVRTVIEHELVPPRPGDTLDTYADPLALDKATNDRPVERFHSSETGDHGMDWESSTGIEGTNNVTVGLSIPGHELTCEAELSYSEKIGLMARVPPGGTYDFFVLNDPPGLRVTIEAEDST
jgi:hypothetical protein